MERHEQVRITALAAVGLTFVLMVLGAWVKATGSGLACPDWPACYGQWLPPFPSADNGGLDQQGDPVVYSQAQILYEWGHRALASIVGVVTGLLLYFTYKWDARPRLLWHLTLIAFPLVVVQAILGGLTVRYGNAPPLTTLHAATAMVFLSTLVLAAAVIHLMPRPRFPGEHHA